MGQEPEKIQNNDCSTLCLTPCMHKRSPTDSHMCCSRSLTTTGKGKDAELCTCSNTYALCSSCTSERCAPPNAPKTAYRTVTTKTVDHPCHAQLPPLKPDTSTLFPLSPNLKAARPAHLTRTALVALTANRQQKPNNNAAQLPVTTCG